jgi:hypothetical protein
MRRTEDRLDRDPDFIGVTFPEKYPAREVADHEVLMAFCRDADALAFRVWWEVEGERLFRRHRASKEQP